MAERNWDEIERDYCEGRLPVRAVARKHGLADSTLRRRAQAGGWQRSRAPCKAPSPAAKSAAPDHGEIVRKHRRAVSRLNRLHDDLTDKAGTLVEGAASLRELADSAAAVERLGRIAERVITLERQVFGLDDHPAGEDDSLAEALRKARERAGPLQG